MALSPSRSKTHHHGRSLSLPSRLHPAMSQFDENLATMKASDPASSSLSSMENRLNGLTNLYCNIDDLLMLPHIQQIISQECQEKWVDQVLDGYIRLLDACSTAKDLFSCTKHDIQQLLSALRRKDVHGIHCYETSRRKSKKMIQKSLKDLKSFRSKHNDLSLEKDNETLALVYMLKEAESVTIAMFECLLSYVIGSKVQARQGGWSLLSKLVPSKKVSHQGEETDLNEFKKVDSFLQLSQEDDTQVEELMNHLKEMDSSIQILEEEIECLFRQLIKTRFEENLFRVRASDATCSSLSSMNSRINGLKNLIVKRNGLTKSRMIILGFSMLAAQLKISSHLRKQDEWELLSAIRRKDVHHIHVYLTSTRKSKKMIQKSLKNLRSFRSKDNALSLEKNYEKITLVYMLKDAESVTFSLLESLLSYTMGTKVQERKSGWSLVSKLMHSKKVSHQAEEPYLNEFKKVDSFLQLSQESYTGDEELVNQLKEMDSSIQILEEELECLFRRLIKTRVFLLNILNH
ncbi:hypothetical protein Pfo_002989 [Paulownia fortunei]|nr:hypothetical protein Pfo_002989 [Paulownia fortunei]